MTQDEVLEQHLSRAAERAERLRREASKVLERAVARASAHGWSQRRIGAAVGRSQPEVHRLLRAAPPVEVAETAMHGASSEPAGSAVIELVLTERRDAIVAAAARRGVDRTLLPGVRAGGPDVWLLVVPCPSRAPQHAGRRRFWCRQGASSRSAAGP